MTRFFHTLYGKISFVFLILLLVLGVVLITVSLQSYMNFVRESDQQLNRNLAADLATEFQPFLSEPLDYEGIKHTMHYLMVMNPRVEIYLLDNQGRIVTFFAGENTRVVLDTVALEPIRAFLEDEGKYPILGDDPKQIGRRKAFSVAPVQFDEKVNGYLYTILQGEQYDSASAMIQDSYIVRISALTVLVTFVFTGIVGLTLFAILTKRFRQMTDAVRRFQRGDLQHRIQMDSDDEIGRLANAFDHMADTIVRNIEELKRTDDLRRELIANVSHDLRSPLASIQGYLETILMKAATITQEERARYLQTILDNTVHLNQLVSELFELSKLDARQTQPKPEPFSMAELTQDVVMKFKPQAEKKNMKLEASLPKDLPMVQADIGLIERALSNLIDNAVRYTPEQGAVKIELARQHDSVHISVSDTGTGIAEADLPYVFDRFYRADKSRGASPAGSGLGLAIAKRILELHESTISVQSGRTSGTTFSFDLKLA